MVERIYSRAAAPHPIAQAFLSADKDSSISNPSDCTLPPQRFRQNSLPQVATLLKLLSEGKYSSQIESILGKQKSVIHYYIKKLLNYGFIEKKERIEHTRSGDLIKKDRGTVILYRLTQAGSTFLAGIESDVVGPKIRLHNVYYKYPILKEPRISIDWHSVEMSNWTQLVGTELGLSVRKNPHSVEVVCSTVDGNDPFELLLLARDEADNLASHLEAKFRMLLGRPTLSRKPHFGISDPVAGTLSNYYELSTDVGRIDASLGIGEIDWFTPIAAAEYLRMPKRVILLGDDHRNILEGFRLFSQGIEQRFRQLDELIELVKALTECAPNPDTETSVEDEEA